MFLLLFTLLFSVACSAGVFAQDLEEAFDRERENQFTGSQPVASADMIAPYFDKKVFINTATVYDLEKLFWISERQMNHLLKYRERFGNLLSKYELYLIPSWDSTTVKRTIPYLLFAFRETIPDRTKGLVINRFQYKPASSASYAGNNIKHYSRLFLEKEERFSAGVTIEKDAGEKFRWKPEEKKYGHDFYSAHVTLRSKKLPARLILGDYIVQAGQGLIFGSGFRLFQGGGIRRGYWAADGIEGYKATRENNFFRGVAAEYALDTHWGNFTGRTFFSVNFHDATIHQDSSGFEYFNTLREGGYHRTASELAARKTLKLKSGGLVINWKSKKKRFRGGVTINHLRFSQIRQPESNWKNIHHFRGNSQLSGSIYFSGRKNNTLFFSELAWSSAPGFIAGVIANPADAFRFSLLARYYHPGYYGQFANGFRSSGATKNEKGIMAAIKWNVFYRFSIELSYDVHNNPWISYRANNSSSGTEVRLTLKGQLPGKTHVRARMLFDESEKTVTHNQLPLRPLMPVNRKRFQIQLSNRNIFEVKHQVQIAVNQNGKSILFNQQLAKRWGRFNLRFSSVFYDSFDDGARQFIYENGLLYTFSVASYSRPGLKNFLLVQWKLSRNWFIYFKTSRTSHFKEPGWTKEWTWEGQLIYKINR